MSNRAPSLFDHGTPPEPPSGPGAGVPLAAPTGWPAPPGPAAYHGLVGEIVRKLEPETEADPLAILSQLLVSFGAAIGRGAWFQVEATRHHPNEFLSVGRRLSPSPEGFVLGSRVAAAVRRGPHDRRTDPDRPQQRRGPRLGGARPHRAGPRRTRPTAAGRRAGVRERAQERHPRDLDALPDAALRLGLKAATTADPHRASTRHQRAHRADRAHHPGRVAPPHQHDRARQRVHKPPDLDRVPAHQAAARRRQPRAARRHRTGPAARRHPPTRPPSGRATPRQTRPRSVVGRIHPPR